MLWWALIPADMSHVLHSPLGVCLSDIVDSLRLCLCDHFSLNFVHLPWLSSLLSYTVSSFVCFICVCCCYYFFLLCCVFQVCTGSFILKKWPDALCFLWYNGICAQNRPSARLGGLQKYYDEWYYRHLDCAGKWTRSNHLARNFPTLNVNYCQIGKLAILETKSSMSPRSTLPPPPWQLQAHFHEVRKTIASST